MTTPRPKSLTAATVLAVVVIAAWLALERCKTTTGSAIAPNDVEQLSRTEVETAATVAGSTGAEGRARAAIEASPVTATTSPADEPTTIEIHVHFPDTNRPRTVRLRAIADDDGEGVAEASCSGRGDEAIGYLDVPPHRWLSIEAVAIDPATGSTAQVPGRRVILGDGERHRIDLQCRGPSTRLRVVGPSPRLAPLLRVAIGSRDPTADRVHRFEVPLDASGEVTCRLAGAISAGVALTPQRPSADGESIHLMTADGSGVFDAFAGTIELTPVEPVLGVTVVDAGRPVKAAVAIDGTHLPDTPVTCTIVGRAGAESHSALVLRVEGRGHFRATAIADRDTDLWTIDLATAQPLGELLVEFDDSPVTATIPPLIALPVGGGQATPLDRGRLALLEPGDYELAWAPGGTPDRTALDHVRITAGETTSVNLAPRSLDRWRVQLVSPAQVGQNMTLHHAGVHSLGGAQANGFVIDLGRAPRIGDRARIDLPDAMTSFAATFIAVDESTHTARLDSELAQASWSRLVYSPLQAGTVELTLLPDQDQPLGGRIVDGRIPMLAGTTRNGCVIETIAGQRQLTRWFEIRAGADELVLASRGSWATLTFRAEPPSAYVILTGPTGRQVTLRVADPNGSQPLFVAEGTTAIAVDLAIGSPQVFDPNQPEFRVTY
ncbi:MAG: hypothetical protein KDC98_00705 [Planctomycetes bacterium]|nr:hypothetical protein [Planctomycetota bacterium]